MKTDTNKDKNKAQVYHRNSQSHATPSKTHAEPEIHSIMSLDKPTKETILSAGNQKILA